MRRGLSLVGIGCLVLVGCEPGGESLAPEEQPTLSTIIEVSGPQTLTPHLEYAFPRHISEVGDVVGYFFETLTSPDDPAEPLYWHDGSLRSLPTLGGWTAAWDVNSSGLVVGESCTAGPWYVRQCFAVAWRDGVLQKLSDVPNSAARAVNEVGQIGGNIDTRAVIWDEDVTRVLEGGNFVSDLNELGEAVGWPRSYWPVGSDHVYLTELPGYDPIQCDVEAINNLGQMVGYCHVNYRSEVIPVMWSDGMIKRLPSPPASPQGEAWDVNDLGQVVGHIGPDLWSLNNNVMWYGERVISLGWGWATGVNGSGTVVGLYNASAALWQVIIRPALPSEEIGILMKAVQDMIDAGTISEGEATSLAALLNAAARQVGNENATAATRLFQAFIMRIEALVHAGRLTEAEAAPLIAAAQNAISQLG